MALTKREYVNNETTITAENLNAIQDSIIALEADAPVVLTEAEYYAMVDAGTVDDDKLYFVTEGNVQ